jgi:hypothetical protein
VCVEGGTKKKVAIGDQRNGYLRKSFPDFPVLMESFFLAALARQPAANPPPSARGKHKRQKALLCAWQ